MVSRVGRSPRPEVQHCVGEQRRDELRVDRFRVVDELASLRGLRRVDTGQLEQALEHEEVLRPILVMASIAIQRLRRRLQQAGLGLTEALLRALDRLEAAAGSREALLLVMALAGVSEAHGELARADVYVFQPGLRERWEPPAARWKRPEQRELERIEGEPRATAQLKSWRLLSRRRQQKPGGQLRRRQGEIAEDPGFAQRQTQGASVTIWLQDTGEQERSGLTIQFGDTGHAEGPLIEVDAQLSKGTDLTNPLRQPAPGVDVPAVQRRPQQAAAAVAKSARTAG